jgi:hypothetical protein
MSSELAVQERNTEVAAVTPMRLIEMAAQRGASIEQMQQLFELKLRVEADEARKAFNAAMAKFKDNPPRISKNKHVKFKTEKGFTEYDHSTLDHVVDRVTAALSAVGISHKWRPKQEGSSITITCILTHLMGHSEETPLTASADASGGKNSIQAIGSTVTYLQRYTLLAAVGMAGGKDDDGVGGDDKEPPRGLPEEELLSALDNIANAAHVTELHNIYSAAYKAARAIGDQESMDVLLAAKDKRKEELK